MQDFFYICSTHLKDTYFCTPKIDEAAIKARREKALAEETEKLKKEYQERQRRKKEKEEAKKKNEEVDKGKTKDEDAIKDVKSDQKGDGQKVDKSEGEVCLFFFVLSSFSPFRVPPPCTLGCCLRSH